MSILEAIFIGIVQGATEFLPISSSGHTILLPMLLDMSNPGLSLIAIAHQGTLLAVLVYFFRDLWDVLVAVLDGLRRGEPLGTRDARLGWYIVLGSVPAALAGLLLGDLFESIFARPVFAAGFLLVTALLLYAGERLVRRRHQSQHKRIRELGAVDALLVGTFQMFALFPGISRSGSTITAALWRGLDRETAARFSFLLGVPAILGAGMMELFKLEPATLDSQLPVFIATFIAAALTGYLCIHFLLTWLKQHSLYVFVAYCAVAGSVYLLLALVGWV
ncbi:MAG TPA: undecaprenyl-diphosphate phosphatase [Candidatus Sulfomarinibacteraceae bacterium]|nr:undecaprenyl-diphosphate phosphatase [Candidatus Sulfomarinibacteraceae bacterium]